MNSYLVPGKFWDTLTPHHQTTTTTESYIQVYFAFDVNLCNFKKVNHISNIRPVQRWLFAPNQRSNQLSCFKFQPNQSSNQLCGLKFNVLPIQRLYQISWFKFEPNQSSSQMSGLTFEPNQSFNQIVCEIISRFKLSLKFLVLSFHEPLSNKFNFKMHVCAYLKDIYW